ncbi:uncharacterized protein SETTUDRAFT_73551, partial [Exserohilum turcica Et28A]
SQPKAAVLFDSWDLHAYKQWRCSIYNEAALDDDDIPLPSAFEYADFLDWRADQGIQTPDLEPEDQAPQLATGNFELATRCGHPLHPGHPMVQAKQNQKQGEEDDDETDQDPILWCPMCTLQAHLKLLAELWHHWLEVGGPWRSLPPGITADVSQLAKRAYYKRKVDLINEIDVIDDFAHFEAIWESSNPGADIEATRPWSATNAMEAYAKGIRFPAQLADEGKAPPYKPPKSKKKRLSYSSDTPEDTRHRPSGLFARRYPFYDPNSPHRCPDEEGWAETSFKNDWEYTIRQCQLLLCDRDPSLPNVTFQKLTDDVSKDRLTDMLNDSFQSMEEDWKQPWANMLLCTTDIFLVWKNEDRSSGHGNEFDSWDKVPTLVGTRLEDFARQTGDIDEEDTTSYSDPVSMSQRVEEDESKDYFDQDSVASDMNEEEEE